MPAFAAVVSFTIAAMLKLNCRQRAFAVMLEERSLFSHPGKVDGFDPSPIYIALKQANMAPWLQVVLSEMKTLGFLDSWSLRFTLQHCTDAKQVTRKERNQQVASFKHALPHDVASYLP